MSNRQNSNSLPMKIVEELTKKLDISQSTYDDAVAKYNAVAKYLGESTNPLLQDAIIYPQGSINLRTVVKPNNQDEFDIDLVIHLPNVTKEHNSDYIHKIIGERLLDEKSRYKDISTPLKRGWRVDYKSNFHLDITPAIDNAFVDAEEFHYTDTAELVPDKKLKEWKDSNPRGFEKWFSEIATQMPIFVIREVKGFDMQASRDIIMENYTIEDIPENNKFKDLLRRTVQLLKKHRDIYFDEREKTLKDFKPISIVITTLATKSYKKIIDDETEYSCPFELMKDIVRNMDIFIKQETEFKVANPTNENENFAEKWNQGINYATAFAKWQKAAYDELVELQKENGLDNLAKVLKSSYGEDSATYIFETLNSEVDKSRGLGKIATSIILATEAVSSVKENKFFGEH